MELFQADDRSETVKGAQKTKKGANKERVFCFFKYTPFQHKYQLVAVDKIF